MAREWHFTKSCKKERKNNQAEPLFDLILCSIVNVCVFIDLLANTVIGHTHAHTQCYTPEAILPNRSSFVCSFSDCTNPISSGQSDLPIKSISVQIYLIHFHYFFISKRRKNIIKKCNSLRTSEKSFLSFHIDFLSFSFKLSDSRSDYRHCLFSVRTRECFALKTRTSVRWMNVWQMVDVERVYRLPFSYVGCHNKWFFLPWICSR